MSGRRDNRAGFTLIELLVVVAVVSVLLGLMLPTLAGARESGRRAGCGSNLRQLGTASQVYADDHRGHMPPGASRFLENLSRWHGSRTNPSERFVSRGGALTEYLGDDTGGEGVASWSAVRQCATFAGTLRALADAQLGFERSCGGYGYNNAYVGVERARRGGRWERVSDERGSGVARFANPAKTICFSDSAFASDAGVAGVVEYSFVEPRFWPELPGTRADPSVHFRHAGRAGVVWLDTHVSYEVMEFSWSSGLYGVDAASVGIGFFGREDDNSLFGDR